MKRLILLFALVVAVLGVPRVRRQLFKEQDPRKIPQIMANAAAVDSYVKCMLATPADAAKICDRIGRRAREFIPAVIEKGDCPSACTEDERRAFGHIVRTMMTKYATHWANVIKHYNVPQDKVTKVEEWAAAIPPL